MNGLWLKMNSKSLGEENVKNCHMCRCKIEEGAVSYPQELVEGEKTVPVTLCEDCMDELHQCPECGIARAYCGECV